MTGIVGACLFNERLAASPPRAVPSRIEQMKRIPRSVLMILL
jgi:hypothetical protein